MMSHFLHNEVSPLQISLQHLHSGKIIKEMPGNVLTDEVPQRHFESPHYTDSKHSPIQQRLMEICCILIYPLSQFSQAMVGKKKKITVYLHVTPMEARNSQTFQH